MSTNETLERELVHGREAVFHDAWAQDTATAAVNVHAAFEAPTAPEHRFILERMGPLSGKRVLDVGTGLGEAAVYFALQGARVTACDISLGMVESAERLADAHGVELDTAVATGEELDFPENYYDIVYAGNLVHHLTQRESFFRNVARCLKPGGRFFTWDPLAYNPAINLYRRMAQDVRTPDERPLTFADLKLARRHFVEVGHREFWIATLALFFKYYLVDRLDPNRVRYWKRIHEETAQSIGWWFAPLARMDAALTRLPLVRRLAWNMVMWGTKPLARTA